MTAKTLADKVKTAGMIAHRSTITNVEDKAVTVVLDPKHFLYDSRVNLPIDEQLVQDIDTNGVMNPVHVWANGSTVDDTPILLVVAGRRRTLHLRVANERRIARGEAARLLPILTVTGSNADLVIHALRENYLRRDETPSSRACKIAMASREGATDSTIAEALGLSLPTVSLYKAMANFDPAVLSALDKNELPIGAANSFLDVPREEQSEVLAKLLQANVKKVHEVKKAVKAARKGDAIDKPAFATMRKRVVLEKLEAPLSSDTTPEGKAMYALLRFILGHEADPRISAFLEPKLGVAPRPRRKFSGDTDD